jgi:hypothetical protein
MDGLTAQTGAVLGGVPIDWQVPETRDLNADGSSDILWRSTEGDVSQWLMDGLTVLEGSVFSSVPNDWVIV